MHSILSHHHSLKHVIPPFLKGIQTLTTSTWIFLLCNNSSVSSKCFPSDPSIYSFINFGPKTLPVRSSLWKWWVQSVVLIDLQAQAPPVDGHTVAWWRWSYFVERDHWTILFGAALGRGVHTPRKRRQRRKHLSGDGDLDHCPAYSTFLYRFCWITASMRFQNSTLKKKTNQRCKRRRSMLRIPILGVSWINYTPTQKSIRKMSCMMTPFRGHHRLQTLWLGLARWGRPEKRSLGAGWLRRPQGDPKWENSELDVFFEVDLRKVLCENRMKYVNTWIWWYVNVCVFFRKSCYKPKWEIAISMLFIQGIQPHVRDT